MLEERHRAQTHKEDGRSSNLDEITVYRRDREVAQHLNCLVPPGEVAVLCMGAAHDVPRHLEEGWTTKVITHAVIYDSIMALANSRHITLPRTWLAIFCAADAHRLDRGVPASNFAPPAINPALGRGFCIRITKRYCTYVKGRPVLDLASTAKIPLPGLGGPHECEQFFETAVL